MKTEFVEFMESLDRIMNQPEELTEASSKGISSVLRKMERAQRQLEGNLHTLTVALSELKKLRLKDDFFQQKDEISERVLDIDKRVIQTLKDSAEDLEKQIGYVRQLAKVEESEEEIV